MSDAAPLEQTLALAQAVQQVLHDESIETVIIGALALAVHGYPRTTSDLDLAVAVEPTRLRRVAERLSELGYDVQMRDPDPQDPLGGVLDVSAPGADLVQVVNFLNPPAGGFPRLVSDSVRHSAPLAGHLLRVVDPYHLIAFKLYAGGGKSKLDILELLDRNRDLDRAKLKTLCESYRLDEELNQVLELEAADS